MHGKYFSKFKEIHYEPCYCKTEERVSEKLNMHIMDWSNDEANSDNSPYVFHYTARLNQRNTK